MRGTGVSHQLQGNGDVPGARDDRAAVSVTGSRRARFLETVWVMLLGAGVLSACGASIQAVYEGDVRFEHCMALDSRPEVKPTIRRACWDEWLRFYTFGQNRDRVEYARVRINQLHMASDFHEGDGQAAKRTAAAAPEPTSALAPPPMTLTSGDAGAPKPATDGGAPRSDEHQADKTPPASACATQCEDAWNVCKRDCKTPGCDKACTAKYKRCMRKCY